jgi:hypothetical protein
MCERTADQTLIIVRDEQVYLQTNRQQVARFYFSCSCFPLTYYFRLALIGLFCKNTLTMDNERDKPGIIFVPVGIIAIVLFLCCKINPPTPPSSPRPHRPPRNPEPAVHVPAMGCAPLHPIVQTPISTPEPVSSPLMLPPPAISSPRDVHSPRSTPSRSPLQPAPADVSSPISEKPPPRNVRFITTTDNWVLFACYFNDLITGILTWVIFTYDCLFTTVSHNTNPRLTASGKCSVAAIAS